MILIRRIVADHFLTKLPAATTTARHCYSEGSMAKRQRSDSDDESDMAASSNSRPRPMSVYVVHTYPEIGITAHVGQHIGFQAKVKERYSDFVVHEITRTGEIVKLTDLSCPPDELDPAIEDMSAESTLKGVVLQNVYDKIVQLSENHKDRESVIEIDVNSLDKEARKKIHRSISQLFPSLNSMTADNASGNKVITVSRKRQYQGVAGRWKFSQPFTHFTLYQENQGTFEAITRLSHYLRMSSKTFSIAGIKDKRGISSQRISCFKLKPARLLSVNKSDNKAILRVGNISFQPKRLELGQLLGNHFKIVLRDVQGDAQDIVDSLNSVREKGFINYFGLQRFGSGYTRSDVVGRFMLNRDWKSAVDAILTPKWRDMDSLNGTFNEAMDKWKETRDAKAIFANFKWKITVEGFVLRELAKAPDNYRNALLAIPRNNRCIYIHAYQSYVWNRLASWRIKEHGLKIVPGDLVIQDRSSSGEEAEVIDEVVIDEDGNVPLSEDEIVKEPEHVGLTLVTEEMLSQYTIYDVVIPMPSIRALEHPVAASAQVVEKMKQLLEEDGTDMTPTANEGGFMIFGSFRKLMAKPGDLKWSTVKYDDEKVTLLKTDLDELNNVEAPATDLTTGSKTAVVMEFSLPSSSYATICIREVMKR